MPFFSSGYLAEWTTGPAKSEVAGQVDPNGVTVSDGMAGKVVPPMCQMLEF